MTGKSCSRFPLQLPASLKDTAMRLARQDGVSPNQWVVSAVAQKTGAVETAEDFLRGRAAGAKTGDLTRYLDKAPDIPPNPRDEMQQS